MSRVVFTLPGLSVVAAVTYELVYTMMTLREPKALPLSGKLTPAETGQNVIAG
jgi:hypothetical protein